MHLARWSGFDLLRHAPGGIKMDAITFRNVVRRISMTLKSANCRRRLCVLVVVAFVMTLLAAGQSVVTGDAVGTVTDPSGAVVSGATVTLTSTDAGTTQSAVTSANGFYRFALLKPGNYTLLVKQSGF